MQEKIHLIMRVVDISQRCEIMKSAIELGWKKCKKCEHFTPNKSQICDYCLQGKYKLLDMKLHVDDGCYGTTYILLEDVLKLIDKFEAKK